MSYWSFVKAAAVTNLDTNPSFESATTGWTAGTGALAQSATYQAMGVYSLRYTPGAGVSDGCYRSYTLSTSTQYTWSISFYGVNAVTYQIRIRNETAGADVTTLAITGTGAWKRHTLTFTSTGSGTSYRFFVEKVGSASTGAYYIDAVQLEQSAYATTYCDGDQEGCVWNGVAHASTSTRSAQSAAGGRVVDFTDSTLAGFTVQQHTGVGMPPVEIIDTLPALGDGADYQRTLYRPREFSLAGYIQGQGGVDNTANRVDYHARRLRLEQEFNARRLATEQAVKIRYILDGKSVEIDSFYAGGLEKGELESPVKENATLRFKAENPFWQKVMGTANGDDGGQQGGVVLGVQQSFANVQLIMRRDSTGAWSSLGPPNAAGTYQDIRAIVEDDTYIYIGGNFQNWDNIANADYVARYNKSTGVWSALGGGLSSIVYALALAPGGDLYIGGAFQNAGGIAAADYLTRWDGSNFNAVGTPLTGAAVITNVQALAFNNSGNLFIGGDFTNWANIAAADNIVMWNGSSYSALSSGCDAAVLALVLMKNGNIAIGGYFTSPGNSVVQWNGSAFVTMGSGISGGAGTVEDLAILSDNRLVIAGSFTSPYKNICIWNGSQYSSLSSTAPNNVVSCVSVGLGDVIYAGGIFTSIGDLTLVDRLAIYSNGVWYPIAIDAPGTPVVYALLANKNDDSLIIGYSAVSGTVIVDTQTTVTNSGSTDAYPIFTLTGPGLLYQLVNETTGKRIYFNNFTLLADEVVTLTISPQGATFESSFRGNVADAILEGSDETEFVLKPGSNTLSLFISDATAAAKALWDINHLSFDGVAA